MQPIHSSLAVMAFVANVAIAIVAIIAIVAVVAVVAAVFIAAKFVAAVVHSCRGRVSC